MFVAILASDRDVPVLWGVAVESEGPPPYLPRRQLIRGALELVDIAEVDGDLARLVPEVFGGPKSEAPGVG